ncbi:MAG: DNA-processing protein DprA [Oscillospiraceae bacterium]|nr:DNA-processing protein DprA [Oscillospiraceae bacterium]
MLKYWLWLAMRKGPGLQGLYRIARSFSNVEQAYRAAPAEYKAVAGVSRIGTLADKDLTQAERIIARCAQLDIRIVTLQDAAYPKILRTLPDAPLILYVKGRLPDTDRPAVGVIGTRKASVYGMSQAKRFGYGLARCGCTVVSGGAEGVDAEAMAGAVMAGGPVVGVLGCGLDVDYPKSNRSLFQETLRVGCLISEFPPGTPPYASNFPQRNRIISGLSQGILVTEAPGRSGALITADHALEQGRDVFVLPANIGVNNFEGNLKLLRDGAIPVGEVWDILQEYESLYPQTLKKADVRMPASIPQAEKADLPPQSIPENKVVDKREDRSYIDLKALSADERTLVELLQNGAMHIDTLVDRSGLSVNGALSCLTMLEIKKIIRRPSPKMYELAD